MFAAGLKIAMFCAASPVLAVAAHAQSAQAPIADAASAAQPAEPERVTLPTGDSEEIIVTANKRSEAIQRVAAAVSALSGPALAERGITDVRGLVTQIPNVTFREQSSAGFISIRGVGTSIDTGLTEPSVATYVDGVYLSRATMRILQQTDLERVEVLRGPQGTLYGRNATGGAINFISAKPTEDFHAGATARLGNFDDIAVNGFLSGPLNEAGTVRVRLSGGGERRDGNIKDLASSYEINNIREIHGRAALQFLPTDGLTIDLTAEYQNNKSTNAYNLALKEVIPIGVLVPAGANITTAPYKIFNDERPFARSKTFIGSGTINWSISDAANFRSITSYVNQSNSVHYDADATDAAYVVINLSRPVWTVSQEFNIFGTTGKLDWLVGAFYFHENFYSDLNPLLPIGVPGAIPPGTSVIRQIRQRTNSVAGFVDLKYALSDTLHILAGLRFNYEKQSYLQKRIGFEIAGLGFIGDMNVPTSKSNNRLLPKVGVQWDVAPRVLTYATFQRGFKSGGLDGSIVNQYYKPEVLDAFEVGVKSSFGSGLGTLNVAGFYYNYKNYQIQKFLDAASTLIENADAHIEGLEAELGLNPVRALRLTAAATLLNSKYTRFESVDLLNASAGLQNLRGNYLNQAPKYSLLGSIEYDLPFGALSFDTLTLRADAIRSGRSYIGAENNVDQRVRANTVANLLANFKGEKGLELRMFVKNFGNTTVKQQIIYSSTQGIYVGNYALQRTYGAELALRF